MRLTGLNLEFEYKGIVDGGEASEYKEFIPSVSQAKLIAYVLRICQYAYAGVKIYPSGIWNQWDIGNDTMVPEISLNLVKII